jgi:hypothetical protein
LRRGEGLIRKAGSKEDKKIRVPEDLLVIGKASEPNEI